uniref:Predicted protein n=1 Tax=Hordeum vulgare subsp. vulgare TaxID=112509 RepID=F2E3M3_HORVV|nr:predicted protein [Hordeum vulgare subsp. vulgare]
MINLLNASINQYNSNQITAIHTMVLEMSIIDKKIIKRLFNLIKTH